jgi:hypothetical protein
MKYSQQLFHIYKFQTNYSNNNCKNRNILSENGRVTVICSFNTQPDAAVGAENGEGIRFD